MARRIVLHIDKHVHLNDVNFNVYRTKDGEETKIMSVFEPSTLKTEYTETAEKLARDEFTPYALYVSRHFEEMPFPELVVGNTNVLPRDVLLFSDDKTVEIHNGDLGLSDGKNVYMSYTYLSMDIKDDNITQSGVTYTGPPATGLRVPRNITLSYDPTLKKLSIKYESDLTPVEYSYRIQAADTDGNKSAFSKTLSAEITQDPADLFFRIERSTTGTDWEAVAYSNMEEWFDDILPIDRPANVHNLTVTPVSSRESILRMENPWYAWENYPRTSYKYRVRAEDMAGEYTEWLVLESVPVHVRPKEILIRRKVDNGAPSSETGDDAIDVYRITEDDIDPSEEFIIRVDDMLSEALKYGFTIFYTDELDMKAVPIYATSDHRPWGNIILFKGTEKSDNILNDDFVTTFELADQIIDIGMIP